MLTEAVMNVVIKDAVGLGVSSTGRRPVNNPDDVRTIQQALNAVSVGQGGPAIKLQESGSMNDQTHQAIKHFQKVQLGFQDGVVDPDKVTIKRLRSLASGGGGSGGGGGGGTSGPVDFVRVLAAAKNATRNGVRSWNLTANIQGTVTAVSATGGKVSSLSFEVALKNAVRNSGASEDFSAAFAAAVFGAWKRFFDNYSIPGLPWYPSFAAIPSPIAPPTPNIPSPLAAGTSSGLAGLQFASLAADIKSKTARTSQGVVGAENFINQFAQWMSSNFSLFITTHQWISVMGSGSVPTFAPPYVPVGPVIGTFLGQPGCLSGPGFLLP